MIKWQKITIADGAAVAALGALPPDLQGLSEESLADLDWTAEELGYRGFGYLAVVDLTELRAQALARLAARRWQEQQTMDWNGQIVPSDDTTLTRIMATVKLAELQGKASGDVVARWKFGPGPLTAITLGQVIAYGIAIGANLQACFNREAELAELVLDAESDAEAILAAAEADWIVPG